MRPLNSITQTGVSNEAPIKDYAPASLDTLAGYLTDGYWAVSGRSGRKFDLTASNEISVNITGLTAAGQQLARWAFEAWESIADISFVETTAVGAKITFDDNDTGAYSSSSTSGGTILSSFVNVSTAWLASSGTLIGSYSLQTYIHEIGHALGLGHQGDYNGSATYPADFENDSWQMSIMSYFDQNENTSINATKGYLVGGMMSDIVAIQNLYGTPGASGMTAGNTVFGANSNLTGYLGDLFGVLFDGEPASGVHNGNPIAFTVYDQGGHDTIDLSTSFTNDRIDLRDEKFSDIMGGIGNMGIARGSIIEDLKTGSGNDTVRGNGQDNVIHTNAGNDTVMAAGGADTVYGGVGMDIINGGRGFDVIDGGADNDRLYGSFGNDEVDGGAGRDRVKGNNGNDTLHGGAGNDWLWGGSGADVFVYKDIANSGYDRIYDFENGVDKIDLSDFNYLSFDDINATQLGNHLKVKMGPNMVFLIHNMLLSDFDASDVIL